MHIDLNVHVTCTFIAAVDRECTEMFFQDSGFNMFKLNFLTHIVKTLTFFFFFFDFFVFNIFDQTV